MKHFEKVDEYKILSTTAGFGRGTAGFGRGSKVELDAREWSCGSIVGGVAIEMLNDKGERDGGWVLPFEALEAWYLAAKKARTP